MASESETVAEVCAELKEAATGENVSCDGLVIEISQDEIWDACELTEAAHKREVDELRECLGSMRAWFRLYFHCDNNPIHPNRSKCTTCRLKSCPCHRWRKVLEGEKEA